MGNEAVVTPYNKTNKQNSPTALNVGRFVDLRD